MAGESPAPVPVPVSVAEDGGRVAILRGSVRGLEIVVDGRAPLDVLAAAVIARLEKAPAFFRSSDVWIRVEDGPLAPGSLARLDEIARSFELRIVEVAAARPSTGNTAPVVVPVAEPMAVAAEPGSEPVAEPMAVAAGSEPVAEPMAVAAGSEPVAEPMAVAAESQPEPVAAEPATAIAAETTTAAEIATDSIGPRIVVGPIRSGVILEHPSHVVIFGDVNPGAEIRAAGSIVVLGRLRGTAHAGIGAEASFILALRLQPHQLRIGRMVARAADKDVPGTQAEIAHIVGEDIVVEEYRGRLPSALAACLQEDLHG